MLASVERWGSEAAAGWCTITGEGSKGDTDKVFPWASVTKLVTSAAVWVAVEEGTVGWDDPAGPPGATLRHVLSHASGLSPDSDRVLAPPGRRRIYSNRGIEVAAEHVARASGMEFAEYAREAVVAPLGMASMEITGSPASAGQGSLTDLLRLARELLSATLVSRATLDLARSVAFPGLSGVLPGFGRQEPNDWGLGVEIRGLKHPHWTGRLNSPQTFGHFGQSGAFLWVDPEAGLALASLSDRPFGEWATAAWPALADAVLEAHGRTSGAP
ncbi:MAG: beta-lactamase family protein [Acidimicrobiales bacterium]|nr:beta-lactamase family protein [Acidimicrobiales bacterium]